VSILGIGNNLVLTKKVKMKKALLFLTIVTVAGGGCGSKEVLQESSIYEACETIASLRFTHPWESRTVIFNDLINIGKEAVAILDARMRQIDIGNLSTTPQIPASSLIANIDEFNELLSILSLLLKDGNERIFINRTYSHFKEYKGLIIRGQTYGLPSGPVSSYKHPPGMLEDIIRRASIRRRVTPDYRTALSLLDKSESGDEVAGVAKEAFNFLLLSEEVPPLPKVEMKTVSGKLLYNIILLLRSQKDTTKSIIHMLQRLPAAIHRTEILYSLSRFPRPSRSELSRVFECMLNSSNEDEQMCGAAGLFALKLPTADRLLTEFILRADEKTPSVLRAFDSVLFLRRETALFWYAIIALLVDRSEGFVRVVAKRTLNAAFDNAGLSTTKDWLTVISERQRKVTKSEAFIQRKRYALMLKQAVLPALRNKYTVIP